MFLTKEALTESDLKKLLEEVLLEMNERFNEKNGDNKADLPVRLSLSLSANGVNRVNSSICMCPDSNGVFVPTKCKPGGGCPP